MPAPSDPVHCPPTSPHDLSVYAAYLRELLLHFAGRVVYYESWVEPNHTSMWAGGVDPAQYATLLETEYRVFQATDPQDKLMFAGVADFGIEDGSPSGIAVLPYKMCIRDRPMAANRPSPPSVIVPKLRIETSKPLAPNNRYSMLSRHLLRPAYPKEADGLTSGPAAIAMMAAGPFGSLHDR